MVLAQRMPKQPSCIILFMKRSHILNQQVSVQAFWVVKGYVMYQRYFL